MRTLTAAIQFGSSRICAAAAWINPDGTYEVAAVESVPTGGCIHRGLVASVDDTAGCIKSLMQKLTNRVKSLGAGSLDRAYVGVCSISMHSIVYQPSVLLGDQTEITSDIAHQLEEESMNLQLSDADVLGLSCNGIEVRNQEAVAIHQLIQADKRLMQGVRAAMDRAHVGIVGFIATPLILGDILNPAEKQQGCLLLDLGSHLTSLSIYADNQLKKLIVLPIGCESVTLDIAAQGVRVEEAENIKTNWTDASRPKQSLTVPPANCPVPIQELNIIASSRYEEIAANVLHQIEMAGFRGRLAGGCILTGGGSQQKGLTTLFRKRLEVENVFTRSCTSIRYSSSERKPRQAAVMAMLAYCKESCEVAAVPAEASAAEAKPTVMAEAPAPVATPPVQTPSAAQASSKQSSTASIRKKTTTGIRDFFGDLFSNMEENENEN